MVIDAWVIIDCGVYVIMCAVDFYAGSIGCVLDALFFKVVAYYLDYHCWNMLRIVGKRSGSARLMEVRSRLVLGPVCSMIFTMFLRSMIFIINVVVMLFVCLIIATFPTPVSYILLVCSIPCFVR